MTPSDYTGQVPQPALGPTAAPMREWVARLVAGECTEHEFIAHILQLDVTDADATWEALALLDQQRRRRLLAEGVFQRVKRRLQQHGLGYAASQPVPSQESAVVERPKLQVGAEFTGNPGGSADGNAGSTPAPGGSPWAPLHFREATLPALADDEPAELCLQPGDLLRGRYCIVQVHEQGGNMLIKALDKVRSDLPSGRQCVAIHLLSVERSAQPEVMQRIYRLQSLAHPAIPRIFDVDAEGGRTFFTMDWVDASTLQQLVQREDAVAPGLPAVLSILGALASALCHAHDRDLAHGNLSLATVQVTNRNELRLLDFVLDQRQQQASTSGDCLDFARLAHLLLSKCRAPLVAPSTGLTTPREGALQRPAGLTSQQWRAMDLALRTGDAIAAGRLLDSFASAGALPETSTSATVSTRRRSRWPSTLHWPQWSLQAGAAASLLAVIGLGGYLLLGGVGSNAGVKSGAAVAAMAPAAASAAPAAAPALPSAVPSASASVPPAPAARTYRFTPVMLTSSPTQTGSRASTTTGNGITPENSAAASTPAIQAPHGDVLDLPRAVVRVDGSAPVAKVWVRRRGNLRGPVTFYWWTETGSAQFARDFTQILRRWEVINDGASGIELQIPLTNDAARTQSRAFYVKIDRAGRGAMLGGRTLAQVEILPARTEAVASITALPKQ